MANPLNPLDWIRSAQDWFAKTEFHAEFVGHPSILRWSHYIRSCYVVGTKLTASEISNHFRSVAAKYDLPQRHLVIRVDLSDRSGFLPHKAWEWMRRQLDNID